VVRFWLEYGLIIKLNLPISYRLFACLSRKVSISFFRNRLSPLGPMRRLGNTPRSLHFLTVLTWMFNKLAASLTGIKASVSSASASETPSAEYSVTATSVHGYPIFLYFILLLKIRQPYLFLFSNECTNSIQSKSYVVPWSYKYSTQ